MLKIIGAGLGRTGTVSLKIALETLDFGPCYHMSEIFNGRPDHVAIWKAAVEGETVNWTSLFDGYNAAIDWPTCHFWRELADH
ncbi:MAG: sulfotransferase family protein, partial [Candidatus Tectomicrobia bacterium]|nr:sulfotransferase family protein [Candidatus Tectomicrobia bacterium]